MYRNYSLNPACTSRAPGANLSSDKAPDQSEPCDNLGLGRGSIVILSLVSPREKFWGVLLGISPSGIWLRGVDLGSFDGAVTMIRNGEQSAAIDVFFPMHRVERMEADADTSGIPSLQRRFEKATGQDPRQFLECKD